ncbi:MAG: LLM class flavin-dependent oxidoreductase [Alphaproteobacteria bacterium]|nr:LLM class flavin-dependent oxidoreductase [Alphaproteobacteria bacterium]
MTLVGFLQAQNCAQLASSWRHPLSRTDFMSAEYYQTIARVLEEGKFHLGFFDDRLSMPDIYGGDHAHTVQHGIRCVKMDPLIVLTIMGMATRRLGLGATCSTTYQQPFHVARVFQTLDLMTEGRAAWNVVTSLNDGEAMNMGRDEHIEHDLRYDQADEFMEIVLGHWDSWEDDALVVDKSTGLFAHPEKVHRIDFKGRYHQSRGPFTVPRTQQGHPVIIQAGSSGRGKRFAARWAELVFVSYHDIQEGKRAYADLKAAIGEAGRNPDECQITTLIWTVVGATKTEAEEKMALIEKLPIEVDQLSLLSESLNYDFAKRGLDEAVPAEELAGLTGGHSMRDRVIRATGKPNPTVRDFMEVTQRGRPRNPFVGGPKEVADGLEQWFGERACDGFVLSATHTPGTYEDFVRLVVPELQRRGLYRKDYTGTTLRDNLGLPRPEIGAWRKAGA